MFQSFSAPNSWSSISNRFPNANLVIKLRELHKVLKVWNREIFGNLDNKLIAVQVDITALEACSDLQSLSDADSIRLASLRSEFDQLSNHIESLWHQKSRLNWNLNGDRNTKYFHMVASIHSKNNLISEFLIDGVCYSQAELLSAPFSEDEIISTLMSSADNKAPGPEGFNYFFYKKVWKSLKTDCISLFDEFYTLAAFPIGFGYERKKFLLKLDFRKAFDTISWQFILQTLQRMNFNSKWISWISACFDSAQLSVLLNGCPTDNFFMEKGVRQGDPISPMLFVLAVECLRAIFAKACALGLLSGIHVDGLIDDLFILQFAADTLLFITCDLMMVESLLRILRWFELIISGLKINYQKSSIICINVDANSHSRASAILNCKIEKLPITYLGLPLFDRAVGSKLWDPVISNFSVQLSIWRGNLLSPAGRLTLIKSVLCSLPVYFLCTFRIPQSVVVSLERIIRRFLWAGNSNIKGFSKVAWPDVCVPYSSGGLSITPLRTKNYCLFLKWIWKLMSPDKNPNWFSVVLSSSSIISWIDLDSVNVLRLSHIWKHNWLAAGPLNRSFPDLFLLSRSKDVMVSAIFHNDLQQFTGFSWFRRLRVGEQHRLSDLVQQLPQASALLISPDMPVWAGSFLSAASDLEGNYSASDSVFVWLLVRDRISSKATLAWRGILHSDLSSCSVCSEEETGIHIVLHCNFAWNFWSILLSKCIVSWVFPGSLDDFYSQWARNNRVFKEGSQDVISLLYLSVSKAVEFHKSQNRGFPYTGNDPFLNRTIFVASHSCHLQLNKLADMPFLNRTIFVASHSCHLQLSNLADMVTSQTTNPT
ncbi:uncharacterized protein LOC126656731 [Mercurialis annua]|uniref:uncharacterized protein LOC126656731 n=1 Tax=Mercurialis annua TaxID=3986 RepID=UPI00215E55D8|nr:uncharacterized protein LOC126656731 [Mercurialis annua]